MAAAVNPVTTPSAGTSQIAANQSNIAAGQKNLDTGYTTFLSLLTTQLKNQDPTSPLDTNAFTQQLVSMTGVQQQLLTNQLLQQLVSGSSGAQGVSGAVGMIGKTVTATSADATLSGGKADWSYTLGGNAKEATLSIVDSAGKPVWSGPASSLSAGEHAFRWDGRDSSGRQLADGGKYTLKVAAADATGGTVSSTLSIKGQVTAVSQLNGQTVLTLGASQVPLSQVTAVSGS